MIAPLSIFMSFLAISPGLLDHGKRDAHPRWDHICGEVTYGSEVRPRMCDPHPYPRSCG